MYITKHNTSIILRWRKKVAMKFPFAPVALNDSNSLFGTSFFLIYLDLKMTYENILLHMLSYCT